MTSASGVYKQKKEFQVQAIFTITTLFLLLINVLHIMYFGVWDSYPILEYTFFLIIIGYLGRNLALNPSLVFRLSGLSSYAIAYLSLIIIGITNIFLGDCDCLRDMPLVVDFCLNTTNCAKVNGAEEMKDSLSSTSFSFESFKNCTGTPDLVQKVGDSVKSLASGDTAKQVPTRDTKP